MPSQKEHQDEKEALEELFELDVREVTVVAPVAGNNTSSCQCNTRVTYC